MSAPNGKSAVPTHESDDSSMSGLRDMDHPTQYRFIRTLCMLRHYDNAIVPETDVSASIDLAEENDHHRSGADGFSDEAKKSD